MTSMYPVWGGGTWIDLPVPESGGEQVVVPNVNAVVYDGIERRRILLQRRDKPGEVVRGRWEVPGGRWRAGERPDVAVAREVEEETGVVVTAVAGAVEILGHEANVETAAARPVAVVVGLAGAYPSLHVVFECYGEGTPRALAGETAEPGWWDVDEVRARMESTPEEFVWHTFGILRAVLG
jgi:8-oxo-dGTP diphosphatase